MRPDMPRPRAVYSRLLRAGAVLLSRHARASFAQEGEDLLVDRILGAPACGCYVDVGAHHPFRFSNTALFYMRGWSGLNIDAAPGSMGKFARWRRRDRNLEIGVARRRGVAEFFVFSEPALSTFDAAIARLRVQEGSELVRRVVVPCAPLSEILHEHCPSKVIDFLSVDVEGHDLEVLQSNDWKRFRARVCIVEVLSTPFEELDQHPVVQFLSGLGYQLVSRLHNSTVFCDAAASQESRRGGGESPGRPLTP